jgi:glucose-6-phosphate isomerase
MLEISTLLSRFDPFQGTVNEQITARRYLLDLKGIFADERAFEQAVETKDNPLIYTVASVTPADGPGQLHYGIGKIMPGRIGEEYYMTKGHYHAWRSAAEFYIGLEGAGMMLLEDEASGASLAVPLTPHSVVYVPGHTAHRTMNTGDVPLTYLGVYPAEAGHDYGAIATQNFRQVVVMANGEPAVLDRAAYHRMLSTGRSEA